MGIPDTHYLHLAPELASEPRPYGPLAPPPLGARSEGGAGSGSRSVIGRVGATEATPWSTRRAVRAGVTEKSNVWNNSSRQAATLRLLELLLYQPAGCAPHRPFGVTGPPEDGRAAAKQEPSCLSSDRLPSKWDAIPSTPEPSRRRGFQQPVEGKLGIMQFPTCTALHKSSATFPGSLNYSLGQAETQVPDPSCCKALPTLPRSE